MPSLKVNQITNAAGTGAPDFEDGIKYAGSATSSLNTYQYTESATAPSSPNNGALWWDTTNTAVKIYANNAWRTVTLSAEDSTPAAFMGDRGVFANGRALSSTKVDTIDYINITTTGNATDFGDTSYGTSWKNPGGASNGTRGVFSGGEVQSSQSNTIHYVTISTTGDSTDFGDLTPSATMEIAGSSDGTYGLFWQGRSHQGSIDYVTIATTANASDFGDATYSAYNSAAASGKTRNFGFGIYAQQASNNGRTIEYVTVQTPGNATDFGDLTSASDKGSSASDNNRSVMALGIDYITGSVVYSNVLNYITHDTTGNATDFGDLTVGKMGTMGCSNATRGIFASGSNPSGRVSSIDYITIQTTGNAADFGDITVARYHGASFAGNAA